MTTDEANHFSDGSPQASISSFPDILLASDNIRVGESLRRKLREEGFAIHLAPSYHALELLWQQQRHPVILLEVSNIHAVDAAVDAAMRIKRRDSRQFVGYLADPILRTSGLAGDAIFPRSLDLLPGALRTHFSRRPHEAT
jgi:hypothetical protein